MSTYLTQLRHRPQAYFHRTVGHTPVKQIAPSCGRPNYGANWPRLVLLFNRTGCAFFIACDMYLLNPVHLDPVRS